MPKRCILILLDGIGDRAYPELNHRTPLQAAQTPVLDQLARDGANGLYHAAQLGQALPSENAHFTMFGYDMDRFPGRGALEALGAGIPIDNGEVAVLAHFAHVKRASDGTLMLQNVKALASGEELAALIQAVARLQIDDIEVRFHQTKGLLGILTLSGPVAPFVTDSDPMRLDSPLIAIQPWATHAHQPEARNTAHALGAYLEWAHLRLHDHPVNGRRREKGLPPLNALVTQRAGQLKSVPSFEACNGLKGLSIASGIVYHGLAAYLGMDAAKVADTHEPGKDMAKRLRMALTSLGRYDFIHVHTKAPDEAAHTKDPMAKLRAIEELDQGIGTVLEELLAQPDLLLVVAADHSTPSAGPLVHCGEPVPLIFYGPGIRRDAVPCYDEISAAGGALALVRGKELMYLILNHLDRAKLQGTMDGPLDQPYWPGRYEPLRLGACSKRG